MESTDILSWQEAAVAAAAIVVIWSSAVVVVIKLISVWRDRSSKSRKKEISQLADKVSALEQRVKEIESAGKKSK